MTVIQSNTKTKTEEITSKHIPVVTDVDKTLIPIDSGQELFHEFGINRENYFDLMDQFYQEGQHGNQLLTYLKENPETTEELQKHIEQVEAQPREGINTILNYRAQKNMTNAASSAGWEPVIQHLTNGSFDKIIAGKIENGEPQYNGQQQKAERLKQELPETPIMFLGDSNTDLQAIKYAGQNQGYGVAIGETIEEAQQRVDEATLYIGDETPHYTTGAIINELTIPKPHKITTEELRENYGFDFTYGEIETGELATKQQEEEIQQIINKLD